MTSENRTSNVTTKIKIWRKSFGSDVRLYDKRTKGLEVEGFFKIFSLATYVFCSEFTKWFGRYDNISSFVFRSMNHWDTCLTNHFFPDILLFIRWQVALSSPSLSLSLQLLSFSLSLLDKGIKGQECTWVYVIKVERRHVVLWIYTWHTIAWYYVQGDICKTVSPQCQGNIHLNCWK